LYAEVAESGGDASKLDLSRVGNDDPRVETNQLWTGQKKGKISLYAAVYALSDREIDTAAARTEQDNADVANQKRRREPVSEIEGMQDEGDQEMSEVAKGKRRKEDSPTAEELSRKTARRSGRPRSVSFTPGTTAMGPSKRDKKKEEVCVLINIKCLNAIQ
jgi:hypothetical protein